MSTTEDPAQQPGSLGGDRPGGGIASLLRLRPWVRPHRGAMTFMIVAALLAQLAQTLVPLVVQAVVDGPIARHDAAGVWALSGVALVLGVAEAVLFALRRWAMSSSALAIETDLRRDLYEHVQHLPAAFHDAWPSGQLLSRMSTDLSTLRRFVGFAFVFLIANSATVVIGSLLLVRLNWLLGLVVLVLLVPLAVGLRHFEVRYRVQSRRAQDLTGDLATSVEESALGIRVIKSYGRRPRMLQTFTAGATTLRRAELDKVDSTAQFFTLLEAYPLLILAVVTYGGVLAVAHHAMTLGALVGFLTLFLRLIWPLASMGWLLAVTQEAATAAFRIFEVMDASVTVTDPASPATPVDVPRSALRFQRVGFTYPDATAPVLHELDLDVRAGETMALVGATGCGKTTLTALVPRLFDVTAGRVLLDGVDVRDLTLADLRARVSVAFEDATLFSASVRENLTLGREQAGDDEVAEAVELAQAGFVHELPFGLDTRIGEQGLSLSGGQRQRLALARAVLGRPRVLVLDDPLSALDVHTEALVTEALRRVLVGTTALVVAHRASTVLLADRVALMQHGRITDVGTHSELLARSTTYRDLLAQDTELETAR